MKQRISTIFLKIVLMIIGLAVFAFCIFALPVFANNAIKIVPDTAFLKYPFLICMYAAMITFFFVIYQAIMLLGYIDRGEVFAGSSIKALKYIKISGIIITGLLYIAALPATYLVAEVDDAPGLIIIGFAFASIPLVMSAFVAVMQKLLQEAVDIKFENDFTV
ncbi:DUF2975 domain-containing protein [Lacrimispora sp.]|uniref:DUF2975 domain-containing protein n=1 Tax=Lacrimispora sp. TaxID=2719234 RepID=UPI003460E10F